MRLPHPKAIRTHACAVLGLIVVTLLVVPVFAQHSGGNGIPQDWTHHYLVFSDPGTEEDALRSGTYDDWARIVNDRRYVAQQLRRRASVQGPAADVVSRINAAARDEEAAWVGIAPEGGPIHGWSRSPLFPKPAPQVLQKDWTASILTGAVLPNMFPAKYTFNPIGPATAATCPTDYVAYPTGSAGAAGAATIVAFNNLYATTCSGTVPGTYWAFNTGTGATVTTSPVLSSDGTKVAFVQGTAASVSLVVLKWTSSGTVGAPGTPTSSANITTCTAPCMTVTSLSATVGDSFSSPFYDYKNDALYVGDNASHLYKATPVFTGSAPTITSVTLNATAYSVASPVYDAVSGCVFVGDSEGYLYSVTSGAGGSVCSGAAFALFGHSEILGDGAANEGIFDAPLVDSTAGRVYVFVTDSAAIGNCAAVHNCVFQFTTATITSGSTTAAPANEEQLGTGGAAFNMLAGAFDNVYYSSGSATPSGNLYVVGNTAAAGGGILYRVPITSNAMGAPVSAVTVNSTHQVWATPITEFCNNGASACVVTTGGTCGAGVTCTTTGTDYLFFSVNRASVGGSCTNATGDGCVLAYDVNTTTPSLSSSLNLLFPDSAGSAGCWGTSAFIIDNASASTGASQVYFVNFGQNFPSAGTTSCADTGTHTGNTMDATQAQQSNLQL